MLAENQKTVDLNNLMELGETYEIKDLELAGAASKSGVQVLQLNLDDRWFEVKKIPANLLTERTHVIVNNLSSEELETIKTQLTEQYRFLEI